MTSPALTDTQPGIGAADEPKESPMSQANMAVVPAPRDLLVRAFSLLPVSQPRREIDDLLEAYPLGGGQGSRPAQEPVVPICAEDIARVAWEARRAFIADDVGEDDDMGPWPPEAAKFGWVEDDSEHVRAVQLAEAKALLAYLEAHQAAVSTAERVGWPELERVAKRCTEGDPWYTSEDLITQSYGSLLPQDRAFIAAASPAAVLELIAAARAGAVGIAAGDEPGLPPPPATDRAEGGQ